MALASLAPLAFATQEVHLAVSGADNKSGSSQKNAVATLQRAFDLSSSLATTSNPVHIVIWPGIFRDQGVVIEQGDYIGKISIRSEETNHDNVVRFLGAGEGATWLKLKGSKGLLTGLDIRGLIIENYGTAIDLIGNRNTLDQGNGGTVIENNVFLHIGSTRESTLISPTAAIRLTNSKDNKIIANRFISIRKRIACGGMHAIYLAHFSSNNEIRNNDFSDLCGSAIKLRDRSNDNLIFNNKFSKLESEPAIEEWFCDKATRHDCTKTAGECPSSGNLANKNVLQDSPNAKLLIIRGGSVLRTWCEVNDFKRPRVMLKS